MTLFACVVGDSQEERAVGKTGETLQHGSGSGFSFSFGFGGWTVKVVIMAIVKINVER